jgi:hypothetical protein
MNEIADKKRLAKNTAYDENQISDCTGGHKVMQFDTASQN